MSWPKGTPIYCDRCHATWALAAKTIDLNVLSEACLFEYPDGTPVRDSDAFRCRNCGLAGTIAATQHTLVIGLAFTNERNPYICQHCSMYRVEHAPDGKCLFQPTVFESISWLP